MPELISFLISDLDVLKAAGALWSALQDEDQHIPDLEPAVQPRPEKVPLADRLAALFD